MREMVEDYSRQLEVRDQHIRRLEAACDGEVAMLAQKEVEVLKQENRMLRDKWPTCRMRSPTLEQVLLPMPTTEPCKTRSTASANF